MKLILLTIIILIPYLSFSQIDPCEGDADVVGSLSAGSPYYINLEAGVMGLNQRLGVYGGLRMYEMASHGKQQSYENRYVPIARISYTFYKREDIRAYFTTYFCRPDEYGFSLRFGYVLGDNVMLCLEPGYSREQKFIAGLCMMARF